MDERNESAMDEKNSPSKKLEKIVKAVMQVYPMIVWANLSQNMYTMVRDEGFLCRDVSPEGCYDDMIDDGVENIHPNYQGLFLQCFSRENLLKNFGIGKNEVYAEIYQKDKKGEYHWVSVHVIRIEDESGDLISICLNRILDEASIKEYGQRR